MDYSNYQHDMECLLIRCAMQKHTKVDGTEEINRSASDNKQQHENEKKAHTKPHEQRMKWECGWKVFSCEGIVFYKYTKAPRFSLCVIMHVWDDNGAPLFFHVFVV